MYMWKMSNNILHNTMLKCQYKISTLKNICLSNQATIIWILIIIKWKIISQLFVNNTCIIYILYLRCSKSNENLFSVLYCVEVLDLFCWKLLGGRVCFILLVSTNFRTEMVWKIQFSHHAQHLLFCTCINCAPHWQNIHP